MRITIPGQTRSKKNSKAIRYSRKKGSSKLIPFIGSGDLYLAWEKATVKWLEEQGYPAWNGSYPVEVKFFVFRDSHRKWDVDNVYCGSLDVLQQAGILKDDDITHVIPVLSGWAIDKKNPRVELLITEPTKTYYREDLFVGK